MADVLGLGDGGLEAGESLAVELLHQLISLESLPHICFLPPGWKNDIYLGGCDDHLDFAAGSAQDLTKFIADALEQTQPVVLGKGGKEVLDSLVVAGAANALLELGYDGALVGVRKRRRRQDACEFGILGVQVAEGAHGFRGLVEG